MSLPLAAVSSCARWQFSHHILLAPRIELWQPALSDRIGRQKKYTMKLASANRVGFAKKPHPRERASARIVLLAAVSFLLGVAATALWFHLAAKRNAGMPGFPTNRQPSAEQPAAAAANAPAAAHPGMSNPPPINPAAIEEVKRAIPNFASVSVEDGENILRTAALKEFEAAAKESDVQIKAAQQQLLQVENGQSAAEQQAAIKRVQKTQAEAAEKLQQVAARLQAQIAALKSLKNSE